MERPLDTIRAFEHAIDKGYSARQSGHYGGMCKNRIWHCCGLMYEVGSNMQSAIQSRRNSAAIWGNNNSSAPSTYRSFRAHDPHLPPSTCRITSHILTGSSGCSWHSNLPVLIILLSLRPYSLSRQPWRPSDPPRPTLKIHQPWSTTQQSWPGPLR